MSTKEKEKHFLEAARYMENAAELLRTKADRKDRYYQDLKYVKMASAQRTMPRLWRWKLSLK